LSYLWAGCAGGLWLSHLGLGLLAIEDPDSLLGSGGLRSVVCAFVVD
jgi:hypothetical protein